MTNLKVDNLAFGNIICSPEWKVIEKGAVFHRIYYVYGGAALYKDGLQQFNLLKDYIYIFPANKPYEITHDPVQPLKCLWFHISTAPLILNPASCVNVRESSTMFYLLKTIESIIGTCGEEYKRADVLLSQLIESLVSLLNKEIRFSTLSDERLAKALDFIHEHYCEKLTTQYLSNLAGFDHSYFIRLFKKTFGVSPQRYISDYRFSKALGFLLEKISISEVAERVGFQDAKAFSRAFKKSKGLPPFEYVKSQSLQP